VDLRELSGFEENLLERLDNRLICAIVRSPTQKRNPTRKHNMKTHIENREIKTSADFAQTNFTIKASSKAFKILSDSLYSDKIRAVIRELSCNAYDSHIQAGNDMNFDVHLPSRLDSTFYIRDYGTGLSKEDCEHLYTTYFDSTKTNTNDAVGCLGLGSKSPFAYTTMFTVTSFFNGFQYVYSAILNEQGMPTILLVNESETDEHNGLKVQFSVNEVDVSEFLAKSEKVFKYFDGEVRPNILGNSIDVSPAKYSFATDTWAIEESASKYYYRHQANDIMGNVCYPISIEKCDFTSVEQRIIRNTDIDMFFEIGEVDVAASREGLSYDDRTVEAIRTRLKEVVEFQKGYIEEKIAEQDSFWEAVSWFKSHRKNNPIVDYVTQMKDFSYNGKELSNYIEINKSEFVGIDDTFSIQQFTIKSRWNRTSNTNKLVISNLGFIQNSRFSVNPSSSIVFINDCKSRHVDRLRKYIQDNANAVAVESSLILFKFEDSTIFDKLKSSLLVNDIVYLSTIELPKVDRQKKSSKGVSKSLLSDVFSFSNCSYRKWDVMKDSEIDTLEKEGGVVVPITRWIPGSYGDYDYFQKDYSWVRKACVSVGVDMPKVYGVKKAKYDKFMESGNYVTWNSFMKDTVVNFGNTFKDEIVARNTLDESCFTRLLKLLTYLYQNNKRVKNCLLKDIFKDYKFCMSRSKINNGKSSHGYVQNSQLDFWVRIGKRDNFSSDKKVKGVFSKMNKMSRNVCSNLDKMESNHPFVCKAINSMWRIDDKMFSECMDFINYIGSSRKPVSKPSSEIKGADGDDCLGKQVVESESDACV